MRTYWLMDQLDVEGPTALVEVDGGLYIIDVLRFGPSVTELEDQQRIWDHAINRLVPTMKPFIDASEVKEEGVAPHTGLFRGESGSGGSKRAGRSQVGGGGRATRRGGHTARHAGGRSRAR